MTVMHVRVTAASVIIHIGLLIGLCGCKEKNGEAAGGADAAFKVALLTPGPIGDQAWNAGAYAGLMRIRDSIGAQTSHIQTRSPAEFEENFRQYGRQGYDL